MKWDIRGLSDDITAPIGDGPIDPIPTYDNPNED
jgi:hypothetical protein